MFQATRQSMKQSLVRYRLSHFGVRLLAGVNLLVIGLDSLYPPFGHTLANGPLGAAMTRWAILSVFALPIFVGFEAYWMRTIKVERAAIWLDAAFAAAWFVAFWIAILYAFTHHMIL